MRHVMQSMKTGAIELIDAPVPIPHYRHVLIQSRKTLISAGTERMLLEFGQGNWLQRALQHPDKVKQVLSKAHVDGVSATLAAVRSKLDQPLALGYCNAGIVRAIGPDVTHVKVGDRVVSNGGHGECVLVGRNLVAKIPEDVSLEHAAFTPLAAIALQGLRLAKPSLGETFCVMGLGLIGLMTVQLLRAQGCAVIGVDYAADRLALARQWGAEIVDLSQGEDPVAAALVQTQGRGVDGVIVAVASDSQRPMQHAAQMSRQRGRIILVGVTGLNLSRADYYEKELTFQVSCSYGPGRYDPNYEDHGEDYPIGYVRWTEQRNFEAVLDAMASGALDVAPLISKTFDIADAQSAYAALGDRSDTSLGLILNYPSETLNRSRTQISLRASVGAPAASPRPNTGVVALVGAGDFGARVTGPGLKAAGARLKTLVTHSGIGAATAGRRIGFENISTDFDAVLQDSEIDTVIIATRHDSHAHMTCQALRAGKHVYVEKPLALTLTDIDAVEAAWRGPSQAAPQSRHENADVASLHLMVGFNRRFSPYAVKMKSLLDRVSEPKCLVATINAGSIPRDHWVHDPVQGGGRIIGEACHMIDLMRFFIGHPIRSLHNTTLGAPTADGVAADKATITLTFEEGSIATVHYFANGPAGLPKERYEAFAGNRFLRLNNFKSLECIGWPRQLGMREQGLRLKRSGRALFKSRHDKGHSAALAAFIHAVQNGTPTPIPISETFEVSRAVINAAHQTAVSGFQNGPQ